MIKLIKKYFSLEQRLRRKRLRQLGYEITNAQNYNELVRLVDTYNTLKNEN
jgi:hypothetical protein